MESTKQISKKISKLRCKYTFDIVSEIFSKAFDLNYQLLLKRCALIAGKWFTINSENRISSFEKISTINT